MTPDYHLAKLSQQPEYYLSKTDRILSSIYNEIDYSRPSNVAKRKKRDWQKVAKEELTVYAWAGSVLGFGSELACLRVLCWETIGGYRTNGVRMENGPSGYYVRFELP